MNDMEIFDTLPKPLRDVLNRTSFKYKAESAMADLMSGHHPIETVSLIQAIDAKRRTEYPPMVNLNER